MASMQDGERQVDTKWIELCDSCNTKCDDVMTDVNELFRLRKVNANTQALGAQARLKVNNVTNLVSQLEDSANKSFQTQSITAKEHERRLNLVSNMRQRKDDILTLIRRATSAVSEDGDSEREKLLVNSQPKTYGSSSSKRVWGAETDATRALDNQGLLDQQKMLMKEQENNLDSFLAIIKRQKAIAQVISDELVAQKHLLDDLESAVDNSNNRIKRSTEYVMKIDNKAKMGGALCLIVMLIVAAVLLVIFL